VPITALGPCQKVDCVANPQQPCPRRDTLRGFVGEHRLRADDWQ